MERMHWEGKMGQSYWRRRVDHKNPSERHWEALRNIGLVEAEEGRGRSNAGHLYDNMYTGNNALMMSQDIYPTNGYMSRGSSTQHHATNYLPGVSYSLDHLDRLDYQAPEMSAYQPTSESCLLGCYNTGETEQKNSSRQVVLPAPLIFEQSEILTNKGKKSFRSRTLTLVISYMQSNYYPTWRPLGYISLNELDSRLGCDPDSPHNRVPLSEGETDAISSLPGHTPSSQGSSSSSESLVSSEPSDSGFHSVSTGEHRSRHKNAHHLLLGHSPHKQRGHWDLESIPETMLMSHTGAQQSSRCMVGNSTTTRVHFNRAEKSPTLLCKRSLPSPSPGCRTEPCQRRALWLEQHQARGCTIEVPGCSRTVMDLSEAQQHRRESHPMKPNLVTKQVQNSQPHPANNTLVLMSQDSYPAYLSIDRTSLTSHQRTRTGQSAGSNREEDSRSHSLVSSGSTDWRTFQTLGNQARIQKGSAGPYYNTLGAHRKPRSPPSPHCRQSNQKSVRNQLLRARAYKLARERSEVTTDEEVHGDGEGPGDHLGVDGPWAGRYWNRAERRRHLVLSRQHRERRSGDEPMGSGGQSSLSSQMVLELSHRKQNRLRNSKLLDDWTTVEELLTHGTRVEVDIQLCPSPLLSVTTV
ncbi:uncharacterized protein LOC133473516 isoform X2 [Phyllopteryx taeniolatus]|nr:uncharacterized protein LOC133473516 isoform X2 [Phyllopteryx taeniolatus]